MIRTHPVSGRKALFVNGGFTTRIVGSSRGRRATRCCSSSSGTWRRRSSTAASAGSRDSVAFWDNRCVQHHAMWDYYPQRRHGHRVTIKGDKPFYRP